MGLHSHTCIQLHVNQHVHKYVCIKDDLSLSFYLTNASAKKTGNSAISKNLQEDGIQKMAAKEILYIPAYT